MVAAVAAEVLEREGAFVMAEYVLVPAVGAEP